MATIEKRGQSYRITVSSGYDLRGNQIRHKMTWKPSSGMTEKQIEKELQKQAVMFEEKCRTGQFLDGSIKFADFADYWMIEYAKKQLRPTTVNGYEHMMKRIKPAIGHIRLDRLQPHHLMTFYANLQEGGIRKDKKYRPAIDFRRYLKENNITQITLAERAGVSISVIYTVVRDGNISEISAKKIASAIPEKAFDELFAPISGSDRKLAPKTVSHYHRLISSILDKAVKWQVLLSNVCNRVEAPKAERKEARYLDDEQAMMLLDCLESEPLQYRTMITLLLYSGMRRGEMCGLEWSDINFKDCLVDINKSSLYLKDKGIYEDETKNFSSKRVIKIPEFVIQLLAEHRREQSIEKFRLCDQWENSEKIFTQWNGKPIHPDTLTTWFRKFIKRNSLPDACLHSLRHTNATLMIAEGVDLRTVSKRLGHAQMSTTGNIYTHAIQTADEKASDKIGDVLQRKRKEKQA